jgi:hypothetical protein
LLLRAPPPVLFSHENNGSQLVMILDILRAPEAAAVYL